MTIKTPGESLNWKVVEKKVEYKNKGEDQEVSVVYVFEK